MARLRVTDKVGLGRLVLAAAYDPGLREQLIKDPLSLLKPFLEDIPPGHTIRVVSEEPNVSILVLPTKQDVPENLQAIVSTLREEAREYDEARQDVEDSKKTTGDGSIPKDVAEEKYALMVGHTALSPSSRPTGQTPPRVRPRPAAH